MSVEDTQPVPQVQLPAEILWHKSPCLWKIQLVRQERLVVEKEAGELGGQLVSAKLRALFRIDGRIEILLQNRKIIQIVMREEIVQPPCEDLFGEKLWMVVRLVYEEGGQNTVDGVADERELDVGGDPAMAYEILFEPDAHAAGGDGDAFWNEDVICNTELSWFVLPSVAVRLCKAFKTVVGVEVETWHGWILIGWKSID